MAYGEHLAASASVVARCALITLSDTRTEANDRSGQRVKELFSDTSHSIVAYQIISDDPEQLRNLLGQFLATTGIDAIITNGGTGISARDNTIDVVASLLDQPLDGFGEIFRQLSFEQIGSGAMLSRAIGGISRGKPIFALPGSTRAVELALTKLILPELGHLLHELRR